jgi:hypothetical protein
MHHVKARACVRIGDDYQARGLGEVPKFLRTMMGSFVLVQGSISGSQMRTCKKARETTMLSDFPSLDADRTPATDLSSGGTICSIQGSNRTNLAGQVPQHK